MGSQARNHEAGFTFPELIVAITLAVVVAGVGMTVMMTALRIEPKVSARAADIGRARVFIERIGRELRQGESVVTANGTQLTLITFVRRASCGGSTSSTATAIPCRVDYQCATSCTRREMNADGSGGSPVETLVGGLTGAPVFSYATAYSSAPCPGSPSATNPAYICVRLSFPSANGDDSVTLNDGIALRNWFGSS